MHLSLQKLLLVMLLGLATMVAGTGYVQASDDPCDCCPPAVHLMDCATCQVCPLPALLSRPLLVASSAGHAVQSVVRLMFPSSHIEDIWHPPKRMAS